MNFSNVIANAGNATRAPAGWNGTTGSVLLSSIRRYIAKGERIVLDKHGQMDLHATFMHCLYQATGGTNVAAVVTVNHLQAVFEQLCVFKACYELYALLIHAQWDLVWRSGDTMSAAVFAALGLASNISDVAGAAHAAMTSTEEGELVLSSLSTFVGPHVVVCALHRKKDGEHNFRADKVGVEGSVANRVIRVHGAFKEDSMPFNRGFGHATHHHIEKKSLEAAANLISGEDNTPLAGGTIYDGADVGGYTVCEVLESSEALTRRWPSSDEGSAVIFLGIRQVSKMVISLSMKMEDEEVVNAKLSLDLIKTALSTRGPSRAEQPVIMSHMASVIAIACGFNCVKPKDERKLKESGSLESFIENNEDDFQIGKEMGQFISDQEVTASAMESSVLSICTSIIAACRALITTGGNGAILKPGLGGGAPGGGGGGGGSDGFTPSGSHHGGGNQGQAHGGKGGGHGSSFSSGPFTGAGGGGGGKGGKGATGKRNAAAGGGARPKDKSGVPIFANPMHRNSTDSSKPASTPQPKPAAPKTGAGAAPKGASDKPAGAVDTVESLTAKLDVLRAVGPFASDGSPGGVNEEEKVRLATIAHFEKALAEMLM